MSCHSTHAGLFPLSLGLEIFADRGELEAWPMKESPGAGKLKLDLDFLRGATTTYQQQQMQMQRDFPRSPDLSLSSTSSLDSCLGAFPVLPNFSYCNYRSEGTPAERTSSTAADISSGTYRTFSSQQTGTDASSPLQSTLGGVSECSTMMTEDPMTASSDSAVASSDDATCFSPLVNKTTKVSPQFEQRDRHKIRLAAGSPRKSTAPLCDLQPGRQLYHRQERSLPPVPSIPSHFRGAAESPRKLAHTVIPQASVRREEIAKSKAAPLVKRKDGHHDSLASSYKGRNAVDLSEYSLDTCINSIGIYAATLKMDTGNTGTGLHWTGDRDIVQKKSFSPAMRRTPDRKGDGNGHNMLKVSGSDSTLSRATSRAARALETSRGSSNNIPHSASLGTATSQNTSAEMGRSLSRSTMEHGLAPLQSDTVAGLALAKSTKRGKSSSFRPSTAPEQQRKSRMNFRTLFRPLSRHRRDESPVPGSFADPARPVNRIVADERDERKKRRASKDSEKSFFAPLRLDDLEVLHEGIVDASSFSTGEANPHILPMSTARPAGEMEAIRMTKELPPILLQESDASLQRSVSHTCPRNVEVTEAPYSSFSSLPRSHFTSLSLQEESNRGKRSIHRAVSRCAEVFKPGHDAGIEKKVSDDAISASAHKLGKHGEHVRTKRPPTRERYRDLIKHSTSFLRPSTAPNGETGSARAKSLQRNTEEDRTLPVVYRGDEISHPSPLSEVDMHHLHAHELKRMQLLHSVKPNPSPSRPHDWMPSAVSYPDWRHLSDKERLISPSSSLSTTARSLSSSHRPAPDLRVSQDQLKRMQPVRIMR